MWLHKYIRLQRWCSRSPGENKDDKDDDNDDENCDNDDDNDDVNVDKDIYIANENDDHEKTIKDIDDISENDQNHSFWPSRILVLGGVKTTGPAL